MTSITDPYRAPPLATPPRHAKLESKSRVRVALWWFVYAYPIWLVVSFYATWLTGWIQLGHPPRPMLDDPKSIGGAMDLVYFVPGILLVCMPTLVPLGLAAPFFCPWLERGQQLVLKIAMSLFFATLFIFAVLLLRDDPGRVVEWWFD